MSNVGDSVLIIENGSNLIVLPSINSFVSCLIDGILGILFGVLLRVCNELKEQCESCNIFGNMEMPSILSACLISMETCDNICIYPESYSREDKLAAAALNGQQLSSNHLAQSYGVSCTHILTFPASAIVQPQSSSIVGSNKEGADGLSKSDLHPMDDDFFKFFGAGMGDEEEMMADLISDDVNAKGFNESGNNNEGDQNNAKEKLETLLNQEEIPHLDQQPLAVGYYISTAKCGPLPDWFRGDVSLDTNFHSFKVFIVLIIIIIIIYKISFIKLFPIVNSSYSQ